MKRRTKSLDIPAHVKDAVWERDNHCCVLCGDPRAAPNAHYISRAQGGLGIVQNIVTLCESCHREYDQSPDRKYIRNELRAYLSGVYPDLDEHTLKYRK
ncbi:MAG: HNH endonuclease [Eubacteriales bacterium]|nr:HNH endonuclease [Eubacteriales bacterium]